MSVEYEELKSGTDGKGVVNAKSIPKGMYCYDTKGKCPYWSINREKPTQLNGYCSYLGRGDWESEGFALLWDQVKECGDIAEMVDE